MKKFSVAVSFRWIYRRSNNLCSSRKTEKIAINYGPLIRPMMKASERTQSNIFYLINCHRRLIFRNNKVNWNDSQRREKNFSFGKIARENIILFYVSLSIHKVENCKLKKVIFGHKEKSFEYIFIFVSIVSSLRWLPNAHSHTLGAHAHSRNLLRRLLLAPLLDFIHLCSHFSIGSFPSFSFRCEQLIIVATAMRSNNSNCSCANETERRPSMTFVSTSIDEWREFSFVVEEIYTLPSRFALHSLNVVASFCSSSFLFKFIEMWPLESDFYSLGNLLFLVFFSIEWPQGKLFCGSVDDVDVLIGKMLISFGFSLPSPMALIRFIQIRFHWFQSCDKRNLWKKVSFVNRRIWSKSINKIDCSWFGHKRKARKKLIFYSIRKMLACARVHIKTTSKRHFFCTKKRIKLFSFLSVLSFAYLFRSWRARDQIFLSFIVWCDQNAQQRLISFLFSSFIFFFCALFVDVCNNKRFTRGEYQKIDWKSEPQTDVSII